VDGLTPAAQGVIHRLITAHSYMSPGELAPRAADVRVIAIRHAATEVPSLRTDLKDALSAIVIALPPLAARPADLAPLARAFLRTYGGPDAPRLAEGAEKALAAHAWPGNVRELELVMQAALLQAPSGARALDGLAISAALAARRAVTQPSGAATGGTASPPPGEAPGNAPSAPHVPDAAAGPAADETAALRARLVEVERAELLAAISRASGNKSRAARLLHVSRKTLYARLHRHGLVDEGDAEGPGAPIPGA